MSGRATHTDEHKSLNEPVAGTTHQTNNSAEANVTTLAILPSSYRVALRNGRVSGGRACALSARTSARNSQTLATKS